MKKGQPSGHRTGQTALGNPCVSVRMRLEIFVRVSQSWHCEPLGPEDCHIGGNGDKGGWVSTEVRMSKYMCTHM